MTDTNTKNSETPSCKECPTQNLGFFCSTNTEILKTIEHIKVDTDFKTGELIYSAGTPSEGLYLVVDGVIKMEVPTAEGKTNILGFIGAGGLVGYRSLFGNQVHSANAITVTDSKVSFLPAAAIKQLFGCHKELTLKLVSKLAEDVKQIEQRWLNQIHKSATARIAEALIFLNEHFHDVYWTRREIADWAGTTPETVIRTLSAFENEGLIDRVGYKFLILKPDLMEQKSLAT